MPKEIDIASVAQKSLERVSETGELRPGDIYIMRMYAHATKVPTYKKVISGVSETYDVGKKLLGGLLSILGGIGNE